MGFGKMFHVVLFGESHGCCVGAVVEGVPPGIPFSEEEVNRELALRAPGRRLVSPRREEDRVEILSGVFRGYTTGSPVAMMIRNRDVDSRFYEEVVRWRPRPGHADLAARLYSMGFNDYRGGGHYSGRLTAALVAVGVLAKKIIGPHGVRVYAYLETLGRAKCPPPTPDNSLEELRRRRNESPVFCHDISASEKMAKVLEEAIREGDSLGGAIALIIEDAPLGLGAPGLYALDAELAHLLYAIPGVRAVELGAGARHAEARGRDVEDHIILDEGKPDLVPGHGGGFAGGHVAARRLVVKVTFKPTSTTRREKKTIDWRTYAETVIQGRGRHDPAIAVRAVPVVEAAAAIVVADHLLRWLPLRIAHYHRLEAMPDRLIDSEEA